MLGFNAVVHKEPIGKVIAGPAIAKVGMYHNSNILFIDITEKLRTVWKKCALEKCVKLRFQCKIQLMNWF